MASDYRKYVQRIESKLFAYEYFNNRTLEMLKNSLDLGVAYNDLFVLSRSVEDEDLSNSINEALDTLNKARVGYDAMYAQYVHAMTGFWELREHVHAMSKVMIEHEQLLESLKNEI